MLISISNIYEHRLLEIYRLKNRLFSVRGWKKCAVMTNINRYIKKNKEIDQ